MSSTNHADLPQKLKKELIQNPRLLSDAANFVNIAAQYRLVTSQDINYVFQNVNKVVGSNLQFDGTHQLARDVQVFNRLKSMRVSDYDVVIV